jgi:uncharacterized protein YlxP (DUF503 family)
VREDGVGIYVGVLRLDLVVPGAHSLKDRRQGILSIRDRLRHHFDVTFHEIGDGGDPRRQTVVLTTAGNDARVVRSVLDRCVGAVRQHPVVEAAQVDVDVFRWHPSEDWAARMMAELGSAADGSEEPDG